MRLMSNFRCGMGFVALCAAGAMLSGCLGDPTYGTGETQTAQLTNGLGNLVSLPKNNASNIKYQPRPGLVQPPKGEAGQLPPPQQSVASRDDPNWPKSPEDVRKEMVAKIDRETGNTKNLPTGASPRSQEGGHSMYNTDSQTKQFRQALAVEQGTYSGRHFLSDPPNGLEVPASSAPTDQLGESELKKERERKRAAEKQGTGKAWWPF